MTTSHHDVSTHVHERITELMLGGYSIDFACEKGVTGGWTRDDVLEVARAHGWNLDSSGRIPFRERPRQPRGAARQQRRRTDRSVPAVGPVPVPPLPAAFEAIDAAVVGLISATTTREARASVALDGETHVVGPVEVVAEPTLAAASDTETPTEGTAPEASADDAAGTAPDPSGPGHGYAGPDAQPQVSPSRSHSGEGGGLGASDAPAEPPAAETWTWPAGALTPQVVPAEVPTAQDIREQVDEITPRTHEDGSINAQHVALEQTLRERHGHPGYIAELDGPGKFRPDDDAGVRAAADPRLADFLAPVASPDDWVWNPDTKSYESRADEDEESCRGCGCTEREACTFGCAWAAPGLCTSCVDAPPVPAPIDVLAVGLAHSDARVRAAARAVESAIDALCTALTRTGGLRG